MMRERNIWLGAILGIVILLSLIGVLRATLSRGAPVAADVAPGAKPIVAVAELPIRGTQSCSNRGCHGAIEPALDGREKDKVWQNEYAQWAFDEKHANAYQTLHKKESKQIVWLLNGGKRDAAGNKLDDAAHEEKRCLACHANPYIAEMDKDKHKFFVEDEKLFGVGCESCHGSAKQWLVAHTISDADKKRPEENWRKKTNKEKEALGMVPVLDPYRRTEACAGCHVGAPADKAKGLPVRDMNHDMIAAGHPRLNFEMSSFQAHMPPHWRPYDKRGLKQEAVSKEKMWFAGQIASAQAALDLLIHRASQPATWPEFAEYDCYACHHSFAEPSWRVQAERGKRKPGEVPWGSWYFAMPRSFSDGPALTALDDEMRIKPRLPDAKEAIKRAETAREALGKLAKSLDSEKDDVIRKRIWKLIDAGPTKAGESFDSAEQLYLAVHAVSAVKVPLTFNEVTPKTPPKKLFEMLQKLPR